MSDSRQEMLQQIRENFVHLEFQIKGVQALLEAHDVHAGIRQAVADYMADMIEGLGEVRSNVLHMAEMLGVPGNELKQDGHTTLAELFSEMRADEAAGKREYAHMMLRDILKDKTEVAEKGEVRSRGMER